MPTGERERQRESESKREWQAYAKTCNGGEGSRSRIDAALGRQLTGQLAHSLSNLKSSSSLRVRSCVRACPHVSQCLCSFNTFHRHIKRQPQKCV